MKNQKICCFYISEFHLLTILLPYINEKILEEKEISIILQNDITENVGTYLENVGNLSLEKEKIINMGWRKSKDEDLENLKNKNIIVIGEKGYIEKINKYVDKTLDGSEILNCYKINDMERIDKVLEKHDEVLQTKGKKSVKNFSQKEQKSKTIKT